MFFMRPRGDVCRFVFDIRVRYVRIEKDFAVLLKPKHYTYILWYDEKMSTVYLRSERNHDFSSSHIPPSKFGLEWFAEASSDFVFL